MTDSSICPCGSGRSYRDCCGLYLDSGEKPATAEVLMRSRYTAYVLQRENYLLASWHPATRPAKLGLMNEVATQWIDLTVKRHDQQSEERAIVEFVARYKVNGRAHRMHEVSRFVRTDGRWLYVDGDLT